MIYCPPFPLEVTEAGDIYNLVRKVWHQKLIQTCVMVLVAQKGWGQWNPHCFMQGEESLASSMYLSNPKALGFPLSSLLFHRQEYAIFSPTSGPDPQG